MKAMFSHKHKHNETLTDFMQSNKSLYVIKSSNSTHIYLRFLSKRKAILLSYSFPFGNTRYYKQPPTIWDVLPLNKPLSVDKQLKKKPFAWISVKQTRTLVRNLSRYQISELCTHSGLIISLTRSLLTGRSIKVTFCQTWIYLT